MKFIYSFLLLGLLYIFFTTLIRTDIREGDIVEFKNQHREASTGNWENDARGRAEKVYTTGRIWVVGVDTIADGLIGGWRNEAELKIVSKFPLGILFERRK